MAIQLGSPGPIPPGRPRDPVPPEPPRRRRSLFGRVVRGAGWLGRAPGEWAGRSRIVRSASFIGGLAQTLRSGPRPDTRFKTEEDGSFDLRATAFSFSLSVREVEARLAARRRQTALTAYGAFALAWIFLLMWMWQALWSPWTTARIASMIYFLPFCALFFLLAFYNALLNFQVRTGRTATWREYLVTREPFWPS